MIVLLPNGSFYKATYTCWTDTQKACECRCCDCISTFSTDDTAIDMWFDDEYGFTNKPVNLIASGIALSSGQSCYDGVIKGSVCFLACELDSGRTYDLTAEQERLLITALTFLGGRLICKEDING